MKDDFDHGSKNESGTLAAAIANPNLTDLVTRNTIAGLLNKWSVLPNETCPKTQLSVLSLAAKVGKPLTCEFLIERGADFTKPDSQNCPPIFYAFFSGSIETVHTIFSAIANAYNPDPAAGQRAYIDMIYCYASYADGKGLLDVEGYFIDCAHSYWKDILGDMGRYVNQGDRGGANDIFYDRLVPFHENFPFYLFMVLRKQADEERSQKFQDYLHERLQDDFSCEGLYFSEKIRQLHSWRHKTSPTLPPFPGL